MHATVSLAVVAPEGERTGVSVEGEAGERTIRMYSTFVD